MRHKNIHRALSTLENAAADSILPSGIILYKTDIAQAIIENTQVRTDHLTPEISLRLITPECKIYHQPETEGRKVFENDPFWGFYWPGGQAISRYLLDNPQVVRSKTILDVGSGSGACAITAAKCHAKEVVANDIDEVAAIAAKLNAELNGVNIATSCENLIGKPRKEEIILLGDVFYDKEFADMIMPWLKSLREEGKDIFVGDPGRHALTEDKLKFITRVASYELLKSSVVENNGFRTVHVWKFI